MKSAMTAIVAVILEDGEKVVEGVRDACSRAGTDSALVLSGIGMLRNAEIGFWNGTEYETEVFEEPRELTSMAGSVAGQDGQLTVHLHASLSGRDHRGIGGHIVSAEVNNIVEMSVQPYPSGSLGRRYSEKTRLNMLYFETD